MTTALAERSRRGAGYALLVLIGIAFIWLVYRGLTWDLGRDADRASAFRTAIVVRGDLRENVTATGTLKSVTRVEIKSEVAGVVRKIHVEEGDRVAMGQPLVELDLERLADRVAELRAALEARSAEAQLDTVARATADLAEARREYERMTRLFAQRIVAESERDRVRHILTVAEIATHDASAERAAREAAVRQAQAALQKAERDLERGVLRAPIDGVVMERAVEIGSPVADMSASNGGTLVAVIADDQDLRLVAQVDENDIARIALGQPTEVRIDALSGETIAGSVRKVASAGTIDQKVANFAVEVGLPRDPRFRIGMSADAQVLVREHRDVLLVPNTAFVRTEGGPMVRRSNGNAGQFDLIPVREGYSDGFQTVVRDGLREGDVVGIRADVAVP